MVSFMKWIPAVALVLGFINCPQEQAPAPPPQTAAAVAATNAGGTAAQTNNGGSTTGAVEAPPKPAEEGALFSNPLLYEVTKKGNHRTSYIFGTVSAKFEIDFDHSPLAVRQALTSATHAVFEAPMGSKAERERFKLMQMKEGSARRELGSKHFGRVKEITKQETIVLDVMKPWVIYLALEEKLAGKPSMEETFESFATSYRKRIVHLETVQEQIGTLEAVIDFNTIKSLVDEYDKHDKAAQEMAEAYKTGDAEKLKAGMFPADDQRAALYDRLLDRRLDRWATKLETQFGNDETIAVLDARYLVGDKNLIAKLREKGWKVERMK